MNYNGTRQTGVSRAVTASSNQCHIQGPIPITQVTHQERESFKINCIVFLKDFPSLEVSSYHLSLEYLLLSTDPIRTRSNSQKRNENEEKKTKMKQKTAGAFPQSLLLQATTDDVINSY
jgi:hypothetical protein